jgi:hypothetical protein
LRLSAFATVADNRAMAQNALRAIFMSFFLFGLVALQMTRP